MDRGLMEVAAWPDEIADVELVVTEEAEPAEPAPSVTLRPYQREAIEGGRGYPGIRRALDEHGSALLAMATGAGKTITFGSYAKEVIAGDGRALILAQTEDLLIQAQGAMETLGIDAYLEKAEHHARAQAGLFSGPPTCVLGSVATMQGRRLASWDPDYFDLIVFDEGHHATSPTHRKIAAHFRKAKILGATATAERADGTDLGEMFATVAFEYLYADALAEGYLCEIEAIQCHPNPPIDLSDLCLKPGDDFNEGDVEDIISKHVESLIAIIKPELGHRTAILFAPRVASAQAFAQGLGQAGISARVIAGGGKGWRQAPDPRDPLIPEPREVTMAEFRAAKFQVLCNCNAATEGTDVPHVEAAILCRPTKSPGLYAQMAGRPLRKDKRNPGKVARLIDFAWLTGSHQLPSPVTLLAKPGVAPEVVAMAGKLLKDGKGRSPRQALDEAERVHRERAQMRVRIRERAASYSRRVVRIGKEAEGVMAALGMPVGETAAWEGPATKATPDQVRKLAALGMDKAGSLTERRAKNLIIKLTDRQRRGMATIRQVAALSNRGVDSDTAWSLTGRQASDAIDILAPATR